MKSKELSRRHLVILNITSNKKQDWDLLNRKWKDILPSLEISSLTKIYGKRQKILWRKRLKIIQIKEKQEEHGCMLILICFMQLVKSEIILNWQENLSQLVITQWFKQLIISPENMELKVLCLVLLEESSVLI